MGKWVSMRLVSKDVVSEKKSEVDDDIRYSEDIIRPLRGYLALRHLSRVSVRTRLGVCFWLF